MDITISRVSSWFLYTVAEMHFVAIEIEIGFVFVLLFITIMTFISIPDHVLPHFKF
jgi:hypothetical protein